MPFLDRDAVRIRYEDEGSGEPVVLLHGFTSSFERNWVELAWVDELLAAGFRVIGLDARGHGATTKCYTPAECETSFLAADVMAVLDACAVGRAHLVGFSMGAGIALRAAMDHPRRVGAVVVFGIGDKAIRGLHDPDEIYEVAGALRAGSVASEFGRKFRARAELRDNDVAALAAFLDRGGWPGDLVNPRPVVAPVLLVVAERDEYMAATDALVALLPRGTRATVNDDHVGVVRSREARRIAVELLHRHSLARSDAYEAAQSVAGSSKLRATRPKGATT